MDAVILAGGKSERLNGIVAPFHKPFLVVNGDSLLVSAVRFALTITNRVIVVATGENAMPVWQLVRHFKDIRVTLSDEGVGDAIFRGLEMCYDDHVLVLMSDNIFKLNDSFKFRNAHGCAIGIRRQIPNDAQRYTRLIHDRWTEAHNVAGPIDAIWCGPLIVSRSRGLRVLRGKTQIGAYLDEVCPNAQLIECDTIDIGTPDAVQKVTAWQETNNDSQ